MVLGRAPSAPQGNTGLITTVYLIEKKSGASSTLVLPGAAGSAQKPTQKIAGHPKPLTACQGTSKSCRCGTVLYSIVQYASTVHGQPGAGQFDGLAQGSLTALLVLSNAPGQMDPRRPRPS